MIPEVTLSGSPRDRGRAHGEELRNLIAEALAGWFTVLGERTDPVAFTTAIHRSTGFADAVRAHTPDLLAEVEGIAEGAHQPLDVVFAWQLIDECWWYLDQLTDEGRAAEACSAMAVNADGRGLVAQTQDLYREFDGNQVMLRYIDADGLEVLAPSAAGLLAYNGVNSAGLGVCITTLSQLATQDTGVPTGFVMPALLRCRTIDEALAWLRQTPLASGNSWTLGTRDRSVVVEGSATGVDVAADGAVALHTNHALAQRPVIDHLRFDSSEGRLSQLEAMVSPSMTVADAIEMYRTPPICQRRASDTDVLSVVTTIVELAEETRCHVAAGPLDTDELVTYTMSTA